MVGHLNFRTVDEQLHTMLASPLYVQERGANAERLQAYHSERESLMLSSSRDPIVTGKPVAVLSSQSKLNQDTVSDRDQFLSKLVDQPLFGSSVHSVFQFANLANVGKSLLNGNKDHLFIQARSELMKQEHQVGSLNSCIDELQQQTYAQILELQDADHRHVEFRREQVRLQEELVMKEKPFARYSD